MNTKKDKNDDRLSKGVFIGWLLAPIFAILQIHPESWDDTKWYLGLFLIIIVVVLFLFLI